MSVEQAQAFLKRIHEDEAFRTRVEAAPTPADKRAILEAEGYGEVKLRHLSQVLPESMGGELSDEELQQVSGGDISMLTVMSGFTAAGSAVTSGMAVVGAALA
jgi:predicted ribosomally synthesized peptide with nif11-like leader